MKEKESDKNNENEKSPRNNIFFTVAIFILFIMNLVTGIFYWQEKNNETHLAISDLLNPLRVFVADRDVIVNFQPLRKYLIANYENDLEVSVYFEFLNTGANISINKDAEFFPASLLKVPIAMATVKNIEEGKWKWDNEFTLISSDRDSHFGSLYNQADGSRFTIEYLVEKMLEDSDNTAYYMLLRNLEKDVPKQSVWNHLGLQEFFTTDGKISAKRYSVVLRSLYNAAYLSKEDSSKILNLLTKTTFTDYIEQGLPAQMKIAHKIGEIPNKSVYMDAGIVYLPKRPYVLIVMTQGKDKKEAENIMKDISEKTYNYVHSYDGFRD